MNRLNVNQARCEVLFASGLQRSDTLTASVPTEMISRTVRQLGHRGCISLMAQEFGDHPEAAAERMRWIRQLVDEAFASRTVRRAARALGHHGTLAACRASPRQRTSCRLTACGAGSARANETAA